MEFDLGKIVDTKTTKYLKFIAKKYKDRKTLEVSVWNKKEILFLGKIEWIGNRYWFVVNTIIPSIRFDFNCLSEIADYIKNIGE